MTWSDNIWNDMNRMQRQLDRLFASPSLAERNFGNRIRFRDDVYPNYRKAWTEFDETDKEFVLTVELPGIGKDDIRLDTTKTGIEIRRKKNKRKEKTKNSKKQK